MARARNALRSPTSASWARPTSSSAAFDPPEATTAGSETRSRLISYGLLRRDRDRIRDTLSPIRRIVSLKEVGGEVYRGNRKAPATVFGVEPAAHRLGPAVARGRPLTAEDGQRLRNVAVVGPNAARLLFPLQDPLGSVFYVDEQPFRVVGVLEQGSLAGQDVQNDVFIPMPTAMSRFGDQRIRSRAGSREATSVELHAMIVQAGDEGSVIPLSLDVQRALELEHPKLQDVALSVPLGAAATDRADAAAVHGADGGDRGAVAAGGRHRDHEHHAGERDGADPRDRRPAGRWARRGGISWPSSSSRPPRSPGWAA